MTDAKVQAIIARMPSIVVLGLSGYFAASFGVSGAKQLMWLHLGVSDGMTTTVAMALGEWLIFSDRLVTLVGAAVGACKVAVAGFFLLAMMERVATVFRGHPAQEHDALDLAVFGGAALTLLYVVPTWSDGDMDALWGHVANLTLLVVAASSAVYQLRQPVAHPSRTSHISVRPQWKRPTPAPQG